MATRLHRRVVRVSTGLYAGSGRGRKPIVVTLLPGDLLSLRFLGHRKAWSLPFAAALQRAIALEAAVAPRKLKRR